MMTQFDFFKPALLDSKNFTPLTRTPWAGEMLAQSIKRTWVEAQTPIGEAWEFSTDDSFPSKLEQLGKTFSLQSILSDPRAHGHTKTPDFHVLIKLLNASSPLSFQVHPHDNDASLAPNECGKPESWLILEAKPGAGIYLGFSRNILKSDLDHLLTQKQFTSDLLHFVPVRKGDFFEIGPGVSHAVGPGVVILEPQRVVAGKSGKTFRMWDWNRLYDPRGGEAADGKPRELHVKESLKIIDPQQQVGEIYVESLRRRPDVFTLTHTCRWYKYPANPFYQTHFLSSQGGSNLELQQKSGYGCLTVLSGRLSVHSRKRSDAIIGEAGQSVFFPSASFPAFLEVKDPSEFCYVSSLGEAFFSVN